MQHFFLSFWKQCFKNNKFTDFLGGGKFYKIVRSCICIFLKGIYRLTKKNVYKSKAKFAKALRYFAIINKINKKSLSVLEFVNSLFFL